MRKIILLLTACILSFSTYAQNEDLIKVEEDYELLPDPERIVNGLRDTGYNFNTAVADIVDNSIAADATKVA